MLIAQADELQGHCEHDACLTLGGEIRDCGMKIGRMAQEALIELSQEEADGSGPASAERPC